MILAYVDIRPILFILGVLVLLLVVYIFCRIKKKKDKFGKIFGLSFCAYVGLFTFFLTEIGPFVGQRDTREFIMTWKLVEEAEMTNQAIVISSFSKVTFGAGGISFFAAGKELFDLVNHQRGSMIVAPDKVNQMRHALLFKSAADVKKHMQEHAKLVKPKFDLVIDKLKSLDDECGSFTIPTGGYFISFNAPKGKAKKIISICKDLGVSLTPAGSTLSLIHI